MKYRIEYDQPSHGARFCIMQNSDVLARTPGNSAVDRLNAERIVSALIMQAALGIMSDNELERAKRLIEFVEPD